MKILVTGANGQLGSEIKAIQESFNHLDLVYASSKECDITNLDSLRAIINQNNIEGIINCAAYTAVDNAEDQPDQAYLVNATGVQHLVQLAEERNLSLIHISTDYVFNGSKDTPYLPSDEVDPIGVYGNSKRRGEEHIINSDTNSIIIRTSWLYSSFGQNFVKTMLRLGNERDQLGIVNDQYGTPTYARDLANACLTIITEEDLRKNGTIYHFANEGVTTWYSFTKEIFEIANIDCELKPINTADYPTKAERPKYSALSSEKIVNDFRLVNRNWKDALKDCLDLIYQAS